MSNYHSNGENHYHHGDVKNACIEAAFQILNEKGFHNLNLRAVTKKVGVSHNAPYRYFKNKEELVVALIVKIYDEVIELLEEVGNNPTGDIEEDYFKIIKAYVSFVANNREKYRLMTCYMVDDVRLYPKLMNNVQRIFDLSYQVFGGYLNKIDMDYADSVKFVTFCLSTIRGYCNLLLENKLQILYPVIDTNDNNDELLRSISQALVRLAHIKNSAI